MTSIALAVPHTPWVPERAASMARVRPLRDGADSYAEFTGRMSNKQWPRVMWCWLLETGADVLLSVQDDTLPAPHFWPALRAMLPHVGERAVLGLSAVHPLGPTMAAAGHRWYRTQSWLVGWAYAIRRSDLQEFVAFVDTNPDWVAKYNEDELLNRWIQHTGRSSWHPVPTIIDHDTSIKSSYANDDHTHRRATVTWHGYSADALASEDFWLPSGEPKLLPLAWVNTCWHCGKEEGKLRSQETGAYIGTKCLGNMMAFLLGRI